VVLDLNENSLISHDRAKPDFRVAFCELECVMKQIANRRSQEFVIDVELPALMAETTNVAVCR
jgi:hypothetical protein